ncbi:MAG: hypothetical protein J6A89_05710 [Clostridia bacterium]|nr:hypothetical protein [Clostridia bacterium]
MDVNDLKLKLKEKYNLSFDDVKLEDLEEISEIKFSKKSNSNEKLLDFIKSSSNPYMFKCNGKKVKIEFSNTEKRAEECLTSVIKNIYK